MAKCSSENHQGVSSFEYNAVSKYYTLLFDFIRPLDDLEEMLCEEFAGKTMTMIDIYNSHHVGKRFISKNYKDALKSLDEKGKIAVKDSRRRGSFADHIRVTFPK